MPTATPTSASRARRRRIVCALACYPGYQLLAIALFGIPVLGHFAGRIVAADTIDSSAYIWFIAWWPHAIIHGQDPIITTAMFAPDGYNLAWAASIPLPSLLLSPVTALFGPRQAFNVLQLLIPALNASAAFWLCRRLTGRRAAAAAGGLLFGFSPYVISHMAGAPSLALVALVPVAAGLVLARLQGAISRRRLVVLMSVTLSAQFYTGAEVLLTMTVFGMIAAGLAYGLLSDRRPGLRGLAAPLGLAYGVTAVLAAPFLAAMLLGPHYPPIIRGFSADLASLVLPPPLLALAPHAFTYVGSNTEDYLGLGLIAVIVAFALTGRPRRGTWALVAFTTIAGLASLGAHLVVRQHQTPILGPWWPLSQLPLLRDALPSRLSLFVFLGAAAIVSLWLAQAPAERPARRVGTWALTALALVMLIPDPGHAWTTGAADPPFFARGLYRAYLAPGERVVTVPVLGPSERWLADTGFPAALAGGYAGQQDPPGYVRYPAWAGLTAATTLDPSAAGNLRRFLRDKGADAIIVAPGHAALEQSLTATLGIRGRSVGGVSLFRLTSSERAGP